MNLIENRCMYMIQYDTISISDFELSYNRYPIVLESYIKLSTIQIRIPTNLDDDCDTNPISSRWSRRRSSRRSWFWSKFDHILIIIDRFQSFIWLELIKIDHFRSIFLKIKKDCLHVDYLIEKVKFDWKCQKYSRFLTISD